MPLKALKFFFAELNLFEPFSFKAKALLATDFLIHSLLFVKDYTVKKEDLIGSGGQGNLFWNINKCR